MYVHVCVYTHKLFTYAGSNLATLIPLKLCPQLYTLQKVIASHCISKEQQRPGTHGIPYIFPSEDVGS